MQIGFAALISMALALPLMQMTAVVVDSEGHALKAITVVGEDDGTPIFSIEEDFVVPSSAISTPPQVNASKVENVPVSEGSSLNVPCSQTAKEVQEPCIDWLLLSINVALFISVSSLFFWLLSFALSFFATTTEYSEINTMETGGNDSAKEIEANSRMCETFDTLPVYSPSK